MKPNCGDPWGEREDNHTCENITQKRDSEERVAQNLFNVSVRALEERGNYCNLTIRVGKLRRASVTNGRKREAKKPSSDK